MPWEICFGRATDGIRQERYISVNSQVPQAQLKYVVYATACVYRELYGKITDRKKNCVNNYLI